MLSALVVASFVAAAPPSITRGAKGGINGVDLGQTDLALEKSGFKKVDPAGWYEKDRMRARAENGVVTQVGWSLTRDELDQLAGKKDATVEDLAAKLGRCGPNDSHEGGNWLACADNLVLNETLGGIEVRLLAKSETPKTFCDDYVRTGVATPVKGRGTYCLGSWTIPAAMVLADVEKDNRFGFCETVKEGAEWVRRCRELHLIFSGPQKALNRIEYHVPAR